MNYFLYAMIYILVFLMGVTVFSYLNLVIERLPKKEKLTIRHSHCKQCDHEQTWKDVIPIFSRIRYQNRCRYCGSVLPKRPLIVLHYLQESDILQYFLLQCTEFIYPRCCSSL